MINVIGLGYIGLPTALILAANGSEVIGTDINTTLIEQLELGKMPFEENGLTDIFEKACENNIKFSVDYMKADTYIIAVPTPYDKASKRIDPSYVINAFKSILFVCEDDADIIIESTISPGTIDKCIRQLIGNKKINLLHAPERIIPGNMIHELLNNSRTIGADDSNAAERVRYLYSSFCKGEIIITDVRTAEMSKVVENTFRDVNIALANELAKICSVAGLDAYEVIRIANKHPRVNILSPGPGVGGHCISVDPWFLVGDFPTQTNLIRTAREVNDSMPGFVIERLRTIMIEHKRMDYSRVGLYGLTYKENVDDNRESPTLQMLNKWKRSFKVLPKVYDPYVKDVITENQLFSLNEFINAVDIVVIMVGHNELHENTGLFSDKVIFDTRHTGLFANAYYL